MVPPANGGASHDVLKTVVDDHVKYCEYIKKIQFGGMGLILTVGISLSGFVLGELYAVKGRLDVLIGSVNASENRYQDAHKVLSDRLIAIVNANTVREQSLNARIERIRDDMEQLRREMYDRKR